MSCHRYKNKAGTCANHVAGFLPKCITALRQALSARLKSQKNRDEIKNTSDLHGYNIQLNAECSTQKRGNFVGSATGGFCFRFHLGLVS